MSTPEQRAWESLQPVLSAAGLDPHRVENVLMTGFPDVDYAFGNIELKALEAWPKRESTPVKVPHLTGQQLGWLLNRAEAGGRAWLMVRVGVDWFLFNPIAALQVYEGLTRWQWIQRARWSGKLKEGKTRLIDALRGRGN